MEAPPDAGRYAVRGGEADAGDPAVVALFRAPVQCGRVPPIGCTGVLVAPRVVLTAAHCLAADPATLGVLFGGDVSAGGRLGVVERVILHPAFVAETKENDLGLVILDAPVEDVAPVRLPGQPLDATAAGATVRVVGFGQTDERAPLDGRKRAGASRIEAVTERRFRTVPGPALTCRGDSGGPVLLERDGAEVLVGITSTGDPPCLAYADNVQVAPEVDGFIRPALDALAATAPSPRVAASPGAPLCGAACRDDAACPRGFRCAAADDGAPACTLGNLPAGTLGEACDPASCDGCVQVPGQEGWFAHAPCQGPPPVVPPPDAGPTAPRPHDEGCAAPGHTAGAPPWALGALLVSAALRRRAGRRAPACAARGSSGCAPARPRAG